MEKHPNGAAQRGDLSLQVDDSIGGIVVHGA
jgi:hypothetical protein